MEQAVKKVEGIDVNSFYELKNVSKPGPSLVKMFEIVLNFFPQKGKPKKPTDDKTKEFDPLGYWTMAKKELLSNPKQFLRDLIDYDKDHIPETVITLVKPKLEWEEVAEKKVESASKALVPVRINSY